MQKTPHNHSYWEMVFASLAETVLEVLYGFVCKTAGKNYKSWVAKVRCMTNTENKKLIGDLILT